MGQLLLFSFGEESLKRVSTHNIFYSFQFELIGVGCIFTFDIIERERERERERCGRTRQRALVYKS